jgi:hypothetical protein
MNVNFDVVIGTIDYSVDMNSGLETLRGASEVTRQVAETLLTEKVPEKLTNTSKVRTRLMKSFKGSYGQEFCLEVKDLKLNKKLKSIGKKTFSELLSYFIYEALYIETKLLSPKAEELRLGLGELEDLLIQQMRVSSLKHLHSVSICRGLDVELRFRQSRDEQVVLTVLNGDTCSTLTPKIDNTQIKIKASITRLNINTGNGRLLIDGANETVAFGFPTKYKHVQRKAKKTFSSNLDENNGLPSDEWAKLDLGVHTLKLTSGKVIKYLIESIYN